MKYLLDTNTCIYAMKGTYPSVLRKFHEHGRGSLALSALVAAELAYGVENSQRESNRAQLDLFLQSIPVLPWQQTAMWHYARERTRLKRAGTPIGEMDLLIASQALDLGLTVVTINEGEFRRVQGLRVENWID